MNSRRVQSVASCMTIPESIVTRAQAYPDRRWLTLIDAQEGELHLSFGELLDISLRYSRALKTLEVVRGQPVPIILPTSKEFLFVFFGVLLLGAIPVPLYPPVRMREIDAYSDQLRGILKECDAGILVTCKPLQTVMKWITRPMKGSVAVITAEGLDQGNPFSEDLRSISGEDLALIQYTSGSTGSPKGVALSHRNLLENIGAIATDLGYRSDDVGISWLPLYHDMGLIGAILSTIHYSIPLVLFSPIDFIKDPKRWFWAIHRYRGTLSAAPNFAYSLCTRKIKDREIQGLDLSTWRVAINGAEPIHKETLDNFVNRFGRYGFSRSSLLPSYGLAESTLAVTFSPLENEPLVGTYDRKVFEAEGRAVPTAPGENETVHWISVGLPLTGHRVQILGDTHSPLPDGIVGRVAISGPSIMKGYFKNPEATQAVYQNQWLLTGDLGFIDSRHLFITGRIKDLIIKGGRNYYPQDLEQAASRVEGVRPGCVCAFGIPDEERGTERIVLVAETRYRSANQRAELIRKIKHQILQDVGIRPESVVLVLPGQVPKTSSGKIQRTLCRERYLAKGLGAGTGGRLWPWVRLYLRSLVTLPSK